MSRRAHDQRFLEIDVSLQHAHHFVVDHVRFAHFHQLLAFGFDGVQPDIALRVVQRIEVLPPIGIGRVTLQAVLVLGEERLRESRFIRVCRFRQALPKRAYACLRGRNPRRALFAGGFQLAEGGRENIRAHFSPDMARIALTQLLALSRPTIRPAA